MIGCFWLWASIRQCPTNFKEPAVRCPEALIGINGPDQLQLWPPTPPMGQERYLSSAWGHHSVLGNAGEALVFSLATATLVSVCGSCWCGPWPACGILAWWQTCPVALGLSGGLLTVLDPDLWIDQARPQTCLTSVNLPDGRGPWFTVAAISGAALLSLSGAVGWVLL